MPRTRHYTTFLIVLALIIVWTFIFYRIDPEMAVERIGVRNGYLIAFLASALGGVSVFTSTTLFGTVIALAAGGLNPLLLGLFAGAGATIGDSLFFFLGVYGRHALSPTPTSALGRLTAWVNRQPRWLISIIVFFYVGFTPFPNDVLTGSLALAGCRYKRIVVPLLFGNFTLTGAVAYFGQAFF